MILKLIHDTNMRARGQPEKVFTVSLLLRETLRPEFRKFSVRRQTFKTLPATEPLSQLLSSVFAVQKQAALENI